MDEELFFYPSPYPLPQGERKHKVTPQQSYGE